MNDIVDKVWCSLIDVRDQYDYWRRVLLGKPTLSVDEKLTLAFLLYELRLPVESFDQALDAIKSRDIENKEQQVRLLYLQSLQQRSLGKVDDAYHTASNALLIAQNIKSSIRWRLTLQISTYLVEMRKVQYGLDQIEAILQTAEDVPFGVLRDARSNFGALCLLFGHYHVIDSEREKFDEVTKMRLDLHKSMELGRIDILESFVAREWDNKIKKSPQLALEIILATFLFADDQLKQKIKSSWVVPYLNELKGSELFSRALWLIDECVMINHRRSTSLIESLWNDYFSMLLALKLGEREKAVEILTRFLSPAFRELHLFSPLIPHLCLGRLFPDNAVSRSLGSMLSISQKPRTNRFVEVHNNRLIFCDNGEKVELRLDRATTSLQLLRIISGPAGKKTSKQDIHGQLSLDPYDSYVHDSRIYKLLTRLKDRLEQEKIPALWTMFGDNQVEIICDIVLR